MITTGLAEKIQTEGRGFRGYYYQSSPVSDSCMVVLAGDSGKDFLSKAFARWLTEDQHTGALCLTLTEPGGTDGIHCWKLEQVRYALDWLREEGIRRVGILGISMQAVIALSAAARIPELNPVIAFAPADFVPWGFYQRRGREWPSGTSLLCWNGCELPWQPAGLDPQAYWELFCKEKKKYRELHSLSVFAYSQRQHPVQEQCRIPVEQIPGTLVLIGAEDDSMWDSGQAIRRMQQRRGRNCPQAETHVFLYPVGTHLLVPQRLLSRALPAIGGIIPRMFASGRQHPKACREARLDLDCRLSAVFTAWHRN